MDSSQTVRFEWTTRINLMIDEYCRSAWSAQPIQIMVSGSGIHVVRQETSGGFCKRPKLVSTGCPVFCRSLASIKARRSRHRCEPVRQPEQGTDFLQESAPNPSTATSWFLSDSQTVRGRWQERSGGCLLAGFVATAIPHGNSRNHMQHHGEVHRNFAPEFERLPDDRIAVIREFRADVDTGGHPEATHTASIKDDRFDALPPKVQG